jgi:sugar O-acyltransferase (sialic acid O-acetyltransferase NeuD family)
VTVISTAPTRTSIRRPVAPTLDTMPARIAGFGAGGHAKCLVEAVRSVHRYRLVALLDADPARVGASVMGLDVLDQADLSSLRSEGVELAFVGIGHVGDAAPRRRAAAALREAGFRLPEIVHGSASVAVSAVIDDGAQIMAGAIVGAEAVIRRDAIVNAGAIVGHDAHIGECAHLASGSRVAGGAFIGDGALIGAGAVVIQGRSVGVGAVVGAGAVVLDDVPAYARVGGAPARPLAQPHQAAAA